MQVLRAKEEHRSNQTRNAELTAAIKAHSAAEEPSPHARTIEGDALLDALEAGLGWRPLAATTSQICLGFGEPAQYELRVTLVPGAPPSHAVSSVRLLAYDSIDPTAPGAPAHQVVRSAFFARISRELQPLLESTTSIKAVGRTTRAVALHLGRLLDLGREIEHLESRLPVRAMIDPDERGVALSVGFSFFAARAKFMLHLLVTALDPSVPLAWQLEVDETLAARVPVDAPAEPTTALVPKAKEDATWRTVTAIVDANSKGFGRLPRIHSALVRAFCGA